jgi:hypothetical protein
MSRVTKVRGGKLEVVRTVEDTTEYTVQDLVDLRDRIEGHIRNANDEASRLAVDLAVVNADLFKLRG